MKNLAEIIRSISFRVKDKFDGNHVKYHLDDVTKILESPKSSGLSKQRLNELLGYATMATGYYNAIKPGATLGEFPVVNKNIIRENFDAFVSNQIPPPDRIPVVTSGSTGTPFKVFHDKNKKYRNNADTLYFAKKAGYDIGQRLIYLKIWAKQKMASPMHYWLQNMVPVDVIQMTEEHISNLIGRMESYAGTHSILGYVSAMEEICKYLDKFGKNPVKTKVASIITMSETLNDYTRTSMEKYFGAPAYSRYSNLENGILAQQVPRVGSRYLVNTASYVIEILKTDKDEKAEKGELGRIVVTDLFNRAMPMIRYDTGDIGAISKETDEYGNTYLDVVEGRKLDLLFDTKGKLVSSYIVYKNMWQYTEINQYQLVQEDEKVYVFKISTGEIFHKEKKLINEFKEYLGEDADFRIEYVSEIPLLDSGKRRKIVNKYRSK